MSKFQPVAIVGIGCRVPGAQGPEEFWRLLSDGVDAISEVPPERWALDDYFDPDPSVPGKMTTRWGGFLSNVDRFDAAFFGISPREAEHIDPQQRLLMEVAWEALEDAGLPVEKLAGQPVGVFVGMSSFDYGGWQLAQADDIRDGYANTGSALSIAANRLSYLFDLRGPSMVIDTACSSSLVAAYYACQSLDRGESRIALAGGVNLILSPAVTIGFSKLQAMAPDGRCKAFDARADGYVRSEGAGVVVLKPLAQAIADGDRIHAVIRGGSVNQDGRTNGLTAPNGLSQEALVRDALASAGLQPSDIQYVEAHGTGTALGDPIELNALGTVLAAGRPKGSVCGVGSVKSNLGHLEAAAGIAGLIKLALSLERRQVPPSLHFEKPNPYIRFDVLPLRVVTALEPWPADAALARGGVSAFGFGGTNAHLILEEAPARDAQPAPMAGGEASLLAISAKSEEALRALARVYADRLVDLDASSFASVCATAALRRSHHDARLAAVATSGGEMATALRAFLDGERPKHLEVGRRTGSRRRKVAFIFPGQGSQWLGMGRELVMREPVFADAIARCAAAFAEHVEWSLVDELQATPDTSRLEEVDVVQPALFAIEVALAELWRSWGIKPDAVVGHSMGETAAAYIAGALSLADAARIICRRSRLAKRLSGRGAMAVVELSLDKAYAVVAGREDRLSVAVSNSPTSTVLAGDPEALEEVLAGLERDGVFCRPIKVDYASHSPQMDVLRDDLLAVLTGITPRRAAVPLYSTVTGAVVTGTELGAEYWVRNIRQPVLFGGVIEKLLGDGIDVFVEMSPHPILLPAIQQCLQHADRAGVALGSLRRHESERKALLTTLASLYTLGRTVDWSRVLPALAAPADLPTYQWQRERYWIDEEGAQPRAARERSRSRADYPLLGSYLRSAADPAGAHFWHGEVSTNALSFLKDHRVQGHIVLPATAYVEIALEAAREALGGPSSVTLEDLAFENALVLTEGESRPLQVVLTKQLDQLFEWRVYSELPSTIPGAEPAFVRHASGRLRPSAAAPTGDEPSIERVAARCQVERAGEEHYRLLADLGLAYGPAFQGVASVRIGDGEAVGTLRSDAVEPGRFTIHPAVLDASLQVLAAGLSAPGRATLVPVAIDRFRLHRPERVSDVHWVHARWSAVGSRVHGDVRLFDRAGALVAEVSHLTLAPLEGSGAGLADSFYAVAWEPLPLAEQTEQTEPVEEAPHDQGGVSVILAGSVAAGSRFVEALTSRGAQAVLVTPGPAFAVGEGTGEAPWRIDAARAEDYSGVLAAIQAQGRTIGSVVHLGNVWAPASADTCTPDWRSALLLVQALAGGVLTPPPRLWLVTEGAQAVLPGEDVLPFHAPQWGLARTVAQEHPELRCGIVDLPAGDAHASTRALADEILRGGTEPQVALRLGERFVARLTRMDQQALAPPARCVAPPRLAGRPFRIELSQVGNLDTIRFTAASRRCPAPGEVEIEVVSAGLNFRDVLFALGLLPTDGDIVLGHECSGRIVAVGEGVTRWTVGDEVVALAKPTLGSFVRTPAALVERKPSRLDFDDAATVPIALLTAHYALNHLGRLRRGERVLIHSATGAVGLACIRLAQDVGAEIYATAGTAEKRQLLVDLGVRLAMDSRSLSFGDEIMAATGGQGVDVVVNSLAGEALMRGLSILAPGGRFLELGKRDLLEGRQIPLTALEDSRAFFLIDLNSLAERRPDFCGQLLGEALALFEDRKMAPIPKRVFEANQIGDALHFMGRSLHIGKVVVRMAGAEVDVAAPVRVADLIRDDGAYVITGGLGGIGLVTGRWLVAQGARHLVLVGRRPPSPEALQAVTAMERDGARVTVDLFDVADAAAVKDACARWTGSGPPVRGIVHAAGVLDDGIVLQQNAERFERVMAPKVAGAWNLHQATRDLPLDFFVLFSSAASMLGSAGQSNYAAANHFMDALAHHRRTHAEPAVSINWGPWSDVGLAARPDRGGRLAVAGMKSISPTEGMAALEHVLLSAQPQIGVLQVDWAELQAAQPLLTGQPFFSRVVRGAARFADETTIRAQVLAAPAGQRVELLAERLRQHAAGVLRLAPAKIDVDQPLITMGIDSLMAIELRSRVEKDVGVSIPLLQLVKGPSLSELARMLLALMTGTVLPEPAVESAPAAGTEKSLLLTLLSIKEGGRA